MFLRKRAAAISPRSTDRKKFHGLGPYDPETGLTKPAGQPTFSEVFATTLADLAEKDERIVAITAAMPNGTGLDLFRPRHPSAISMLESQRNTRSLRCRMATRGFRPFCAIYSTFLQRAFDPVITTSAFKSFPSSSAWTVPVSPAMTAPRIMVSSTSRISAVFPNWS